MKHPSDELIEALRASASNAALQDADRICQRLDDDLNLSTLEIETLHFIGQISYRARRTDLARRAFVEIISRGHKSASTLRGLGLVELRAGDVEQAVRWFQRSVDLDPSFADSWIELAAAKKRLRFSAESLLDDCLKYVALGQPPKVPSHQEFLKTVAGQTFEAGDRLKAGQIYQYLYDSGDRSVGVTQRLAESHLAGGHASEAAKTLLPLWESGLLDSWGLCSYAIASMETGFYDRAEAAFEQLFAAGIQAYHFDATYLKLRYLRQDIAGARIYVHNILVRYPADVQSTFLFEFHIREGNLTAAAELVRNGSVVPTDGYKFLLIELAYKQLEVGEIDKASTIIDALRNKYAADPHVVVLALQHLIALRNWDRAMEIVRDLPASLLAAPELRLKCFELHAFRRDFSEARKLLETLKPIESLPFNFLPPIIRFLAETKEWHDVVELSLLLLTPEFNYAVIGETLVRSSRRCGTHRKVIDAIEACSEWTESRGLKKLRAILLEDLAHDEDGILELLSDRHVTEFTWAKHRLMQKSLALVSRTSAPGTSEDRHAVFFCTNLTYLCATAVSFYSLLRSNDNALSRFEFFFVVDDNVYEKCCRAFTEVGRYFGVVPTVLRASDIVGSAAGLSAEYGVFTSGHSLAVAAFYRIFFARFARDTLTCRRAAYIDSDTIIVGPLLDLFKSVESMPLSARMEVNRPEVVQAIKTHGLSDGSYFNSGVLVFDLGSSHFPPLIDRTIGAIYDESITLLFHDQCALNIGFQGRVEPLDPKFNFFINMGIDPASVEYDNTILHFLDRPKPWDVSYDGPASAYWYKHWREMASIIGGAFALELLVASQ